MTQKIEDLFIKPKKNITFAPLKHPQLPAEAKVVNRISNSTTTSHTNNIYK